MSLPRTIADLAGTALDKIGVAIGTARIYLKAISGGFVVRNADDSADAALTASQLKVSGENIVLNSDAAATGADWTLTIARPASGQTAAWTWTFPIAPGTSGQVLQTDGSGNTSWVTPSSGASNMLLVDNTTLAFGDSSPVAAMTKPANAEVRTVRFYVTTAFNGTAPTASIGVVGTTSKYGATTQVNLKEIGLYEWDPGVGVVAGAESIIITYAADSSSAGAARVELDYVTPT